MIGLEQMVRDKSVAVVGSAQSFDGARMAQAIDAHDVVIRMNLSIPGAHADARDVGSKTDIWCAARSFVDTETPAGTKHILFMKQGTPLGEADWVLVQKRDVATTRWPANYQAAAREFVGSPPGTGIRILWWLAHRAKPKSVSVYAMDCWQTPSVWSGTNTWDHRPSHEYAAMDQLLRENPHMTDTAP